MDQRLAKKFGEVLRAERIKMNLSQEELAHRCDLDRTFVSMLERGIRQPTLETIVKLAKSLSVSASSLVKKVE